MKQESTKQRIVIVGAGAVGLLTGAFLHRAGHDVTWIVRTGKNTDLGPLRVMRTSGADPFIIAHPQVVAMDSPIPKHDVVMICVRGDQLNDALKQSAKRLSPEVPWVIGAATLDESVSAVRACGVQGAVMTYHVAFGTWLNTSGLLRWFPFSTPGSLVSAEGDKASLPAARMIADCLSNAGLPARSFLSSRRMFRLMAALQIPFIVGWDLCDWNLDRLCADSTIRHLTARGIREAVRAVAHDSGLIAKIISRLPLSFFRAVMGRLPKWISADGKTVWQVHGPKVRLQCLQTVHQLQSRTQWHEECSALSELAYALEEKLA